MITTELINEMKQRAKTVKVLGYFDFNTGVISFKTQGEGDGIIDTHSPIIREDCTWCSCHIYREHKEINAFFCCPHIYAVVNWLGHSNLKECLTAKSYTPEYIREHFPDQDLL